MHAKREDTQCGTTNNDNNFTVRSQSLHDHGVTGRDNGIGHQHNRIRGGHTTFPPKATAGSGRTIHCCCHKKGSESTPTDEFRKKERLGSHKCVLPTILAQYKKQITRQRELFLLIDERIAIPTQLRQTVLDSARSDSARSDPSRIGSHVGYVSTCLVCAYLLIHRTNAAKLQTLH